jgi:hypothetical protein
MNIKQKIKKLEAEIDKLEKEELEEETNKRLLKTIPMSKLDPILNKWKKKSSDLFHENARSRSYGGPSPDHDMSEMINEAKINTIDSFIEDIEKLISK